MPASFSVCGHQGSYSLLLGRLGLELCPIGFIYLLKLFLVRRQPGIGLGGLHFGNLGIFEPFRKIGLCGVVIGRTVALDRCRRKGAGTPVWPQQHIVSLTGFNLGQHKIRREAISHVYLFPRGGEMNEFASHSEFTHVIQIAVLDFKNIGGNRSGDV